jgi:hypothetical protein
MSDFKLTLSNILNTTETAVEIQDTYGEDFDARRGDFVVTPESDGAITILINDVTKGDIQHFTQRLYDEHEDFFIRVSERIGRAYFSIDDEDVS